MRSFVSNSMRTKPVAILASSLITVFLLMVIDQTGCQVRGSCVEDDASIRASGLLLIPLVAIYVLLSWLLVYPFALVLARWLPTFLAALLPSVAFGLSAAFLLHRPDVDGSPLLTLSTLLPWLAIPWFAGGWAAVSLWPRSHRPKVAPPQNEA
jgi:hypothetical protein